MMHRSLTALALWWVAQHLASCAAHTNPERVGVTKSFARGDEVDLNWPEPRPTRGSCNPQQDACGVSARFSGYLRDPLLGPAPAPHLVMTITCERSNTQAKVAYALPPKHDPVPWSLARQWFRGRGGNAPYYPLAHAEPDFYGRNCFTQTMDSIGLELPTSVTEASLQRIWGARPEFPWGNISLAPELNQRSHYRALFLGNDTSSSREVEQPGLFQGLAEVEVTNSRSPRANFENVLQQLEEQGRLPRGKSYPVVLLFLGRAIYHVAGFDIARDGHGNAVLPGRFVNKNGIGPSVWMTLEEVVRSYNDPPGSLKSVVLAVPNAQLCFYPEAAPPSLE